MANNRWRFYNGHYRSTCYLPLFIFDGLSGALVTAVLRPGKRPTGAENAMILKRVLKLTRRRSPDTHILLRGDGHFSNPELMQLIDNMPDTDFIFGLGGNSSLLRQAEPVMQRARALYKQRTAQGESSLCACMNISAMQPVHGTKPIALSSKLSSKGCNKESKVNMVERVNRVEMFAPVSISLGADIRFISKFGN